LINEHCQNKYIVIACAAVIAWCSTKWINKRTSGKTCRGETNLCINSL